MAALKRGCAWPSMATPWAAVLVDSLRGLPAAFAIDIAVERGEPMDVWRAHLLAETWLAGEVAASRIFAHALGVVLQDFPALPEPTDVRPEPIIGDRDTFDDAAAAADRRYGDDWRRELADVKAAREAR